MSTSFELDPVERITAGATGEPGQRVFYLQARSGAQMVTLLAEKEQVQVLAVALDRLLDTLVDVPAEAEPPAQELELEEPLVPAWRAGEISLEYEDRSDHIAIMVQEALPDESNEEPATARLVGRRGQMRALARHAIEVCAAGRPRCQLCGFPIDAEGHACPALNGHRR